MSASLLCAVGSAIVCVGCRKRSARSAAENMCGDNYQGEWLTEEAAIEAQVAAFAAGCGQGVAAQSSGQTQADQETIGGNSEGDAGNKRRERSKGRK